MPSESVLIAPDGPFVSTPVSPLRVLVADGSYDQAYALAAIIQFWGHDACFALDGAAALAAARQMRPHVLVFDLVLPGRSGWQLLREVRQDPALQDTQMIVLTADDEATTRAAARASGVDCFIVKPDVRGELRQILEAVAQPSPDYVLDVQPTG